MANSILDVFAAIQNGVTAINNFGKQLNGSLLNISGKIAAINAQIAAINAPWQPYTPIISVAAGSIVATGTGQFLQNGKTVFVEIIASVSSGGAGNNFIIATLPTAVVTSNSYVLAGREVSVFGKMLQGIIDTPSRVAIQNFDGSYPSSANGTNLVLSGVYQSA